MSSPPRVLVVSHNVFSKSGNMGKTLTDLFSALPADCLAQLYFHSEVPTVPACTRYFRVTDRDMLAGVLRRKARYRIFGRQDIQEQRASSRTDTGAAARVYQFARRRTPLIYAMRNLLWSLGGWDSPALDQWVRDFAPQVIFFASGDYAFAYKIVCRLAQRYRLPVVWWCCDDYYLGKRRSLSPLYHAVWQHRLHWARRVAGHSHALVTICDKMQQDYAALFGLPAQVLRISAQPNPCALPAAQRSRVVYAGNLGLNRLTPLLELGRTLRDAGIPGYDRIHVYSGERDPQKLAQLTEENGICFHGSLPADQMPQLLGQARFLLHLEASDPVSALRTRYSLSTKIGESLQSGACLLAYGPADIASMEYLQAADAAVMLRSAREAPARLQELLDDPARYDGTVQRALELARCCHDKADNDRKLRTLLGDAARKAGTLHENP